MRTEACLMQWNVSAPLLVSMRSISIPYSSLVSSATSLCVFCHSKNPPARFTTVLKPFSVRIEAALADLRPLRQNTATGRSLSSIFSARSVKSLCLKSMSIAPGMVPSAFSSAVRTSTSCSPLSLFSAMYASNSSTLRSLYAFWLQAVPLMHSPANNNFINLFIVW